MCDGHDHATLPDRPLTRRTTIAAGAGLLVVLPRIADPGRANASPGPDRHPCNDLGVA